VGDDVTAEPRAIALAQPFVAADEYETALVVRAQAGDLAAFDELVGLHQAAAQRLAIVLGLNADDAADAAQEAFVNAHRAIGRFRAGAPFRPWLSAIVVNEVRLVRRRAARRARIAVRVASLHESDVDGPEGGLLRSERSASVLEALGRLREHDRLPIVYRYFLDFSEAEMAAAMHVRPGTVKSRLSRALARLKAELGDWP
jgi:RNA polymerase sigma factor (sigma-70 family)